MRSIFLTLLVLLLPLAGGCAGQIGEMPTWVAFDEDGNVETGNDQAVVVLKVAPPAEVLLSPGRIEQNGWRAQGKKSAVWLSARDGFVVAKVAPTHDAMAYAVIGVRPARLAGAQAGMAHTYETGFWSVLPGTAPPDKGGEGVAYGPAGEARVPLCQAIAGRVAFAGTIRIDALRDPDANEAPPKVGITPATSPDDIEAVRRFLAQQYPLVRARVVPIPLQMMRRNESGK